MNLVALLVAPAVVGLWLSGGQWGARAIALVAVLVIVASVIVSKRRPIAVGEVEHDEPAPVAS